MSHVVDFFYNQFGAGGNVIVCVLFIVFSVLGLIIALKGRQVISAIVGFFAAAIGIIGGAMAGLLIFDSFIIMLAAAFIGGILLLLIVKFFDSVGYFIGIGSLAFFIAFTVTSELYISNTRITENTLILFDIIIGIVVGIFAAVRSNYIVTFITAAAGGMMTSIMFLAVFGVYFADFRMWLIAAVVAAMGVVVQLRSGDVKKKTGKKSSSSHKKTRK